MKADAHREPANDLPADVAGKSAEQLKHILALIDAGDLEATKAERAYIAGAVFALKRAQVQD